MIARAEACVAAPAALVAISSGLFGVYTSVEAVRSLAGGAARRDPTAPPCKACQ